MRTFRRREALAAGASVVGAALGAPSVLRAQTADVLKLSSWLPAKSLVVNALFDEWIKDISRLTEGRLKIEYYDKPLGPPPAHADLISSGKADLGYTLHGYTSDRFLRARIGQFSFLGDAYTVSHSFSKIYGGLLEAQAEHDGIEVLGLFQHGPGVLMLRNKRIERPGDFEGLRIRTSGGYISALIEDLGAVNKPMSPFAVKDALANGEIDGVAFPYEAGPAFGITDQITFVSELPGGYYNASWVLGASKPALQQVAPDDLAILRQYSAEAVHLLAAKTFDYADYLAREEFIAKGVEILRTPLEVIVYVEQKASGYEREWIDAVSGQGYDANRALDFMRNPIGDD